MNKHLVKYFIYISINFYILFGQKIVQMNGTYDLDGDKMLEFIALE
jgi:hypothetical protein